MNKYLLALIVATSLLLPNSAQAQKAQWTFTMPPSPAFNGVIPDRHISADYKVGVGGDAALQIYYLNGNNLIGRSIFWINSKGKLRKIIPLPNSGGVYILKVTASRLYVIIGDNGPITRYALNSKGVVVESVYYTGGLDTNSIQASSSVDLDVGFIGFTPSVTNPTKLQFFRY